MGCDVGYAASEEELVLEGLRERSEKLRRERILIERAIKVIERTQRRQRKEVM